MPFCECLVKDLKCQVDTLDDKTSINIIELRKIVVHNLLEKDNIYTKALVPYLPNQREYVQNTKEKMFRLYYRENPAIGGIPIIDHFEINVIPILLQITNKLVNHLLWYIFPDRYKQNAENLDSPEVNQDSFDIDYIIYRSSQQQVDNDDSSDSKTKKKSTNKNNDNENDSILSDNESNTNNTGSNNNTKSGAGGNTSDDETKEMKYADNSDEDIIYDQAPVPEGNSVSTKEATKNKKLSMVSTMSTTGAGESKIEYNVNQMKNRASQNKSFVYIKIPGAHHCISYKGPKNKNISDIFQFTFKFPTLEYRNKTWSWYEFLMAVKKDLTRTVINHVAALMKEKIFKRKLNEKESNKMFGMLDEQIMYKFKKYYKNKYGSSANNNSTSNFSVLSTNTTISNTMNSEANYDEIEFIPEENEDINMEYVEELKEQLFNDNAVTNNDGLDSDNNIMHSKADNLSKDSFTSHSVAGLTLPPSNAENKKDSSKKQKASTLVRDKSSESIDGSFPVPIPESNSRNISKSIPSINSISGISCDYNEYMFIKKRMLFGKYMDDK